MGFVMFKNQTWTCLFFHLGGIPGLTAVGNQSGGNYLIGNKGGIKHCQDSEPAYTEISMHESFLFLALPKASPCKRVIF